MRAASQVFFNSNHMHSQHSITNCKYTERRFAHLLVKTPVSVDAIFEELIQHSITLETTGGHASFLNGKVERPNRTITDMDRALHFNAGHSPDKWCSAAETAANIYRLTLHSAVRISL